MDKLMMETLEKLNIPIASYDPVTRLSSGSMLLDRALGGGWPRGRYSLIFGDTGVGKTSTALLAAAQAIRENGYVAYYDVECTYDPDWGKNLGIDHEKFALFHPALEQNYSEAILDNVLKIIRSGFFDLVVIDSLEALSPKAEMDGEMTDDQLGIRARKLNKFFRMVTADLLTSKTVLLAVNQIREKIGVMYGDPTFIPGGRGQRFYATIMVKLLTPEKVEAKGQGLVGMKYTGRTTKNKTAPNFQEFDVLVRQKPFYGVDRVSELFDLAKEFGIFRNREGQPYNSGFAIYNGIELGKTEADIKAKLDNDLKEGSDLVVSLERDVRAAMQR